MTGTFNPDQGRGGWTTRGKDNDRSYYTWVLGRRRDGARPEVDEWHFCVYRGVQAIKTLLDFHGYPDHGGDDDMKRGIFGRPARREVRRFQQAHGVNGDGAVGPLTMRKLLEPIIAEAANTRNIEPAMLYGISSAESLLDPGAQGFDHPPDKGLWQDNTASTSVSEEEAYDPIGAANRHAQRLKASWEKYQGKGPELRTNCTIAQHNSPVWADQWFEDGEPPSTQIEVYVSRVKERMEAW